MFSDEELVGEPTGTTHNTLSSAVSLGSIKIGQLFENKVNLKMKLHVYAMKKNFEFKVKKSGSNIWFITCIKDNCSWNYELENWRTLRYLRCGYLCLNILVH